MLDQTLCSLPFLRTTVESSVNVYNCRCEVNQTLLTHLISQSKLSQEELTQLQKSTHFDKKELQQWYKGQLPHSHRSRTSMLI